MRYIHDIFTPQTGAFVANSELKEHFLDVLNRGDFDEPTREKLHESINYFLMGDRRRSAVPHWKTLQSFAERAEAFERAVDDALDQIAAHMLRTVGESVVFDAILTTTSTGSLMPSVSYRLAQRLQDKVRHSTMMIDLAHVGCTGGVKLLNLARQLSPELKHCLLVSLEFPTTLMNTTSSRVDVWQGNCTFGDGGAALWVSNERQDDEDLAIEEVTCRQHAAEGLHLIQWGYSDYYSFWLADEKTFNKEVRRFVTDSLSTVDESRLQSPYWAIHPAGLALLLRISRKVGLAKQALKASTDHYAQYSNMSSAGVLHVLRDLSDRAEPGTDLNICTMGAGFNVIYGRVKKGGK